MDKKCIKMHINVSIIKDEKLKYIIESYLIIHVLYFHFTLNIKLNEKPLTSWLVLILIFSFQIMTKYMIQKLISVIYEFYKLIVENSSNFPR